MSPTDAAPDADAPKHGVSACRYLANGLLFLLALATVCVLLDRWLPYPEIPVTGDKIYYLSLHGNEIDTLFIGSSRTNCQVMPSVFDKTLDRHGLTVKSFNVGILGMRPPEEGFFLDRILREPHGKLRWVLVELTSVEALPPPARRGSARYFFWHDAPRMMLLARWMVGEWRTLQAANTGQSMSDRFLDLWGPLSAFLIHVPPFFERSLNLGRAESFRQWCLHGRPKEIKFSPTLGESIDGWAPYSLRETMNARELQSYQESFEARQRAPAVRFHDPASDAAIRAISEAIVRAGATPIFFVPPMTTERQYYPPPEMAEKMTIWSFADSRQYPVLFAPENRADALHMNSAGARQFTLALAERFVEMAKK